MIKELKAEKYKLFKNRTFRVLCVIAVFLSFFMIVMCSPIMEKLINDSLGSLLGMKVSSLFGPSQEEQLMKKILSTSNSPRMMYLYGEY